MLGLHAAGGRWNLDGEQYAEHDEAPLRPPPKDLHAPLAAFLPTPPAAFSDVVDLLRARGVDLDGVDLWMTKEGWRRQGPFGPVVTQVSGIPLEPIPPGYASNRSAYFGPLLAEPEYEEAYLEEEGLSVGESAEAVREGDYGEAVFDGKSRWDRGRCRQVGHMQGGQVELS